jgi:hypothetical protein
VLFRSSLLSFWQWLWCRFPHGTAKGDVVSVPLSVKVRSKSSAVSEVMRIDYLDYAGESLVEAFARPNDTAAAQVLKTIRSADAVLGILDGLRLRRFLSGEDDTEPGQGFEYQLRDLLNCLLAIQRPLHLVLTKWDLLQEDYSPKELVAELAKLEPLTGCQTSGCTPTTMTHM